MTRFLFIILLFGVGYFTGKFIMGTIFLFIEPDTHREVIATMSLLGACFCSFFLIKLKGR